jgi:hypothetical protein
MFKFNLKITSMFLLALALQACEPSPDKRYDTGYSDGYAEGYNTTCKIRATIVEGDWVNENYSRGYKAGNAAGVQSCSDKG